MEQDKKYLYQKRIIARKYGREIKENFYQKKELYQTINQIINHTDLPTLENFYSYLDTDSCYKWVIQYFRLQKPVQRERKQ